MDLKKERGRYREIALKALETSEQARDSDWTYLFNFLFLGSGIRIPRHIRNQIRNSGFNLSTILRERQKIQNSEGLFPPSPEASERRKKKAKEHAEMYKN